MAVLLCFYVNKYPGATKKHLNSCGKSVLLGVNIAIPPFIPGTGRNYLLINKGLECGYTNLCMVTAEKKYPPGQHGKNMGERERGKNHPEQFLFDFRPTRG